MPEGAKEGKSSKYEWIWIYVKATVASQVGSWFDMLCSFLSFSLFSLSAFWSTAIGAFGGGVVNCIINYRWTYHAQGMSKTHIAIKYALVWMGSLLLNTFGTSYLNDVLGRWPWLAHLGMGVDARFAFARVSVSLLVSVFWNILLQRYFVYRPVDIKGWFGFGKNKQKGSDVK